jgi:hypothetical protein
VLLCSGLHQSGHAINVHTVKMCLRSTPNSAGAVHNSIYSAYEAPQTVRIAKISFYPLYGNFDLR